MTIFPITKAEALASSLNADASDDWTYVAKAVAKADGAVDLRHATVDAYDEDGVFVASL